MLKAKYSHGEILIPLTGRTENLHRRGYGNIENGVLKLKSYEGLFLLEKNIIKIFDENGEELEFKKLLGLLEEFEEQVWVKYLIYRDLRSRGYVLREGFGVGLDFRVYDRGEYGQKPAKYIVFGILEGIPIKIRKLMRILEVVQNAKKQLILAVVDRKGEVVYYSLSKLSFG